MRGFNSVGRHGFRFAVMGAALLAGFLAAPVRAAPIEVPASGDAEICRVTREPGPYSLSIGKALAMHVSNDGACSVWLFQLPNGTEAGAPRLPFDRAVMTAAPRLGEVRFSSDEEKTFVTYVPAPGAVGQDRFAFRLMPGNGYYPVAVTVDAPLPKALPPQPASSFVYFDLDKSDLSPEGRAALDRVAAVLEDDAYRDYRLQVSGHADARGGSPYNLKLSQRRTDAVLAYLRAKTKLMPARIRASAYGDSVPLNPTDGRAAENRRVHLVFVRGARALEAPVP